mmetsp:Transcript_95147/g.150470  ORF Transcript_95147/g.150470 Transcript_95147/m.150470 type:complete len:99 (-) Transcript_95147:2-298(-)
MRESLRKHLLRKRFRRYLRTDPKRSDRHGSLQMYFGHENDKEPLRIVRLFSQHFAKIALVVATPLADEPRPPREATKCCGAFDPMHRLSTSKALGLTT